MTKIKKLLALTLMIFVMVAFKKSDVDLKDPYTYYEVGKGKRDDWRDTVFVVRTSDSQLIQQVAAQLGPLKEGSGGFNKNSTH